MPAVLRENLWSRVAVIAIGLVVQTEVCRPHQQICWAKCRRDQNKAHKDGVLFRHQPVPAFTTTVHER